ncbi:substrate-binding domain-containing protein [Chryseobacterium sp. MFBS3-17]|uniref:substrate-binding domain-containing protein n=1 Tax=Chryseobacterium sp. MFBS3-17 TaxID=2886689 RepID=UPI001D0EA87C|nr:substrate-binding domain-containing protein [Chryseobacterium sp. MFBS3-17]MCC2590050.1 substrate-binding domain-containing protein [Chryseobacterium sp. MFBS3-17]
MKKLKVILYTIMPALWLFSCADKQNAMKIKGSDTEVNLAVELAEAFYAGNEAYSLAISGGGSGLGIASLYNGQADIANSSRPLTDDELFLFKEKGIELITHVFAEDATAIVVHPDSPLDEIDTETLGKILSGETDNWKTLTGADLPVNIYGRQSNSGTHSFIRKKLDIKFSPKAKEMNGNAQIMEGIKADPSGIGYVGAGYLLSEDQQNLKVKALKIKETGAATVVSPLDHEAIKAKAYFFQRPLFQFIPVHSWEKVKPFIDFEKTPQGQDLIRKSGYYVVEE